MKDREIIAVGASIAAGCRPCAAYHFRAAQIAGANEQEIRQAVVKSLGRTEDSNAPCGWQGDKGSSAKNAGAEAKTAERVGEPAGSCSCQGR